MAKMDFKTEQGKAKAEEIVKEIFGHFDKVETEYTEYGRLNVTVDDVFEFHFTDDELIQTKAILSLLSLKRLEKKVMIREGRSNENN